MTRKVRSPATLSPRQTVEAALRNGRWAEAVRLALGIPDVNDLLAEAVIRRCREWRHTGQTAFALDLLRKVLPRFGADDELRSRLAHEMVQCGGLAEAMELVADAKPMVAAAADVAVVQGLAGRNALPAELHAGHEAVLAAFAAFEAGDDESARNALNSLGLASPFLEWKVLLRGLIAWRAGDDARALDNWSRLHAERLPSQLIAPLRAGIDPTYRQSQPPDMQATLRHRADRLVGGRSLAELRKLQTLLGNQDDLTPALRQAEVVLPLLRELDAAGEAALLATLTAAIVHHGHRGDIDRWAKFLPRPADDPSLDRLRALVADSFQPPQESVSHWLAYEKVLAGQPAIFGSVTARARAMVLVKAGERLRDNTAGLDSLASTFGMTALPRSKPKASIEAALCFDRALQLAPDLLAAHAGRVQLAIDAGHDDEVIKCGQQLLSFHPNHAETLAELAEACLRLDRPIERVAYTEALRAAEPLNGSRRAAAAAARRAAARARAIAGHFAAADADLEAAAAESPAAVDVQRAALAWMTGDDTAAEAHLAAADLPPAAAAGRVVAEAAALKLPRGIKARFEPVLKSALEVTGDSTTLLALTEMVADHIDEGFNYRGQKSYEKKLETRLRACVKSLNTEGELARACVAARRAGWHKLAFQFARRGEERFRQNPRFPLEQAVAEIELRQFNIEWARDCLQTARGLWGKLPPTDRPAGLDCEIAAALAEIDGIAESTPRPTLNQLFDLFERLPRGRR